MRSFLLIILSLPKDNKLRPGLLLLKFSQTAYVYWLPVENFLAALFFEGCAPFESANLAVAETEVVGDFVPDGAANLAA